MSPFVSIIVPVYNSENTLERCVNSILQQTIQDVEVILVNDGSTDESSELCNYFSNLDQRVRVYHKKNKGVSAARNYGLQMAQGTYVMFCDSDDFVEKNWCEAIVSKSEETHVLQMCQYKRIFQNGKVIISNDLCGNHRGKDIPIIWMWALWRCAFRRDLIEKYALRFDEELRYGEDMLFIMEYIKSVSDGRFCVIDATLYNYVVYEDSLSNKKYIKDRWSVVTRFYDFCLNYEDEWSPEQREKYHSIFLNYFLQCMNNTMLSCELSFKDKVKTNTSYMRDDRYRSVLLNGKPSSNHIYNRLLRGKSYIPLWIYTKLSMMITR